MAPGNRGCEVNAYVEDTAEPPRDVSPPPSIWKKAQIMIRYMGQARALDDNVDLFVPGKKIFIGDDLDEKWTPSYGGNVSECQNKLKDLMGYYTITGYSNKNITLDKLFYGKTSIDYGCVVNAYIEP